MTVCVWLLMAGGGPGCERRIVEPVRVVPQAGPATPRRVVYSPAEDGRLLVLESSGRMGIWEVTDPAHPLQFASIPAGALDAAFMPGGREIVSGGIDGSLHWWSFDGRPLLVSAHAHRSPVRAIAASAELIASADEDGEIALWRPDGTPAGETLRGHAAPVVSLAISPAGEVWSVGGDGTLRRWRLGGDAQPDAEAAVLARQRRPRPNPEVFRALLRGDRNWGWDHSIAISRDGTVVGAALFDGALQWWNADGSRRARRRDAHDRKQVRALAFSPTQDVLASGGFDGTVRLWTGDGTPQRAPIAAHLNLVYSVSFSADGQRLATTGADNRVRLWSLDGTQLGELPPAAPSIVSTIAVAARPAPGVLAIGTDAGVVRRCALDGSGCAAPLATGPAGVVSVALADQSTLAAGTADGAVMVWQGEDAPASWRGPVPLPVAVAIPPAGGPVAAGSDAVRLLAHGDLLWQSPADANDPVTAIAVTATGDRVATGTNLGALSIWNRDGTRAARVELPREHVVAVAFAPDGQTVLSAGGLEPLVRIHALDGSPAGTLEGHRDAVVALAVSSPRRLIATASLDRTVRIWEPGGRQIASLPIGVPIDQIGFADRLFWVRAEAWVYLYDAQWEPVVTGLLSDDGPLLCTSDGWCAGAPAAVDRVEVFDAEGARLSDRARHGRVSSDVIAAALAAALQGS